MTKIKILLVTIGLGLGGGAFWLGLKPGTAEAACQRCYHGTCINDPSRGWTCTQRSDDCASSSGCLEI